MASGDCLTASAGLRHGTAMTIAVFCNKPWVLRALLRALKASDCSMPCIIILPH